MDFSIVGQASRPTKQWGRQANPPPPCGLPTAYAFERPYVAELHLPQLA